MENCSSNVITEAACMLRNTSYVTVLESTTDFTLSPCRKFSKLCLFRDQKILTGFTMVVGENIFWENT